MKALNVAVPLGHDASRCPGVTEIARDFVIIDSSGIHLADLVFCSCYQPGMPITRRDQLLRHKLFPATLKIPKAAFTFEILEEFHLLTLQSKISAYDFYRAIEHKSDNTGIKDLPVRPFSSIPLFRT